MEGPAFSGLLVVVAAFAAPFVLGFFPRVRLPAVVLEIVAGIVAGPSVLGLVQIDSTIDVLATIGLVFLLFLAGREIEFDHLRGRVLRVAGIGWLLSVGIAVVVGLTLTSRSAETARFSVRAAQSSAKPRSALGHPSTWLTSRPAGATSL
jgi:Kef-type K+ transport system membrane component KefB